MAIPCAAPALCSCGCDHAKPKANAERVAQDIRPKTRRQFSAKHKITIVLDGLRGDDSVAELCRHEGVTQSLKYTWSKVFTEAGKRRLTGDTARAAPSSVSHFSYQVPPNR